MYLCGSSGSGPRSSAPYGSWPQSRPSLTPCAKLSRPLHAETMPPLKRSYDPNYATPGDVVALGLFAVVLDNQGKL